MAWAAAAFAMHFHMETAAPLSSRIDSVQASTLDSKYVLERPVRTILGTVHGSPTANYPWDQPLPRLNVNKVAPLTQNQICT